MSDQGAYVSFAAAATETIAERLKPVVEAMAITMADEVRTYIRSSRPQGRLYRIPGTKGPGRRRRRKKSDEYGPLPTSNMYQASAPGQAPAEREGIYRRSWTHTPAVRDGSEVVATAYSALPTPDGKHLLGEILERGHKEGGRMRPRPHVGPAMRLVQPKLRRMIARTK